MEQISKTRSFVNKLLAPLSLIASGLLWHSLISAMFGPEVALALPPLALAGIPAIAGLAGGILGGRGRKFTDPKDIFGRIPGLGFFGGSGRDQAQRGQFRQGIDQLLATASAGGLPGAVRERGLANLASGFESAGQAAGRTAALGFGPASLSPAALEASRARASAGFESEFAEKDLQAKLQQASLIQSLLSFFGQIEGARLGAPVGGGNKLGGALQGLGAGFGLLGNLGFQPFAERGQASNPDAGEAPQTIPG